MSSQDKFTAQGPDLKSRSPAEEIADHELRQLPGNPLDCVAVAPTIEVNLARRRLLIGSAVVGLGGVAAAAIHDGELGGPPQTVRGAVPWQEGTADAPPEASGTGFEFFTPAEV